MTEQEIYKKIEETYNSEKGKGFITHLLRSFFPINKATYAWSREEGVVYKCCITGEKLGTKDDLWKTLHSEEGREAYMNDFKGYMKAIANQEETYEHTEEFMAMKEKIKPLAIVAEKSNKCMSVDAFKQLQNFYFSELLKDNKHINWVANNERAKETVKSGKKDGWIKKKREERAVHRKMEHSTTKLGDLKALQDIRKRIEEQK